MLLQIAICEDDDIQLTKMLGYVKAWAKKKKQLVLLYDFPNADGLLNQLTERKAFHDLFLLDINFNDNIDGFSLAKSIREQHSAVEIVFFSGNDRAFQQARDLFALNYLIKPINAGDIEPILDLISERKSIASYETTSVNDSITVRDKSPLTQGWQGDFPCNGIFTVNRKKQEYGSSSLVCLNDDPRYCIDYSLTELLGLTNQFLARPNDSCLINMLYIKKLIESMVTLRDSRNYIVTPNYSEQFRNSLNIFTDMHPRFASWNVLL